MHSCSIWPLALAAAITVTRDERLWAVPPEARPHAPCLAPHVETTRNEHPLP
jgi:hypothetical protein